MKDTTKKIPTKKKNSINVVKHNSLINIKSDEAFTVSQKKLVCHLIANIKPKEVDFSIKEVALKELGFIDDNMQNYTWFRKEFLQLLKMPFVIPNDGGWANWFSYLKYEKGIIKYSFDPRLKPFLLELKGNFTIYNLDNVLNLKTNYAITLFELLMKNIRIGKLKIEIEEFIKVMNLPNYPNGELKRYLTRIQKEIIENTIINFSFEFVKQGAKAKYILFKIKNNASKKDLQSNVEETKNLLKNGKQQEMFNEEIVVAAIETKVEDNNQSLRDKFKNLRMINDRQ